MPDVNTKDLDGLSFAFLSLIRPDLPFHRWQKQFYPVGDCLLQICHCTGPGITNATFRHHPDQALFVKFQPDLKDIQFFTPVNRQNPVGGILLTGSR